MPTNARCPHCSATVPYRADWCSLCHADLRPQQPVTTTEPAPHGAASSRAASGRHRRAEPADGVNPAEVLSIGRHSAPAADARTPAAPAPLGRHGRGAIAVADEPHESSAQVEALLADVPADEDGKPDMDVLTNQLMARLQATESRSSGVFAVDSLPGGKWGVLLGGMAAVTIVVFLLMTLAGRLLG